MIELIEVLLQPVSICLLFFCRAGTDLSKCSDLYGISLRSRTCHKPVEADVKRKFDIGGGGRAVSGYVNYFAVCNFSFFSHSVNSPWTQCQHV